MITMSMDKMIGFTAGSMSIGADSNWVQSNLTILDNSAGVIPKTIRSIFVEAQCYAETSNKIYFAMLYVTPQDAAVPNFAGNDSAMSTALNNYRDNIWTTQGGLVKYSANGLSDDALIPFEPKTGRKLEPGQKLVMIWLSRNSANTTASTLVTFTDWNIWFDY